MPLQEHGVACARAENLELLRAGCCNLAKHITNAHLFGVPVVVAINRFATDTDAELELVQQEALAAGECREVGVCVSDYGGGTFECPAGTCPLSP